MTAERLVRGCAGFFVLLSVALAHYHHPYWLFFTAFVGLNLLQSAFTNWCPAMSIFKFCLVKEKAKETKNSCCQEGDCSEE